MVLDRQGGPNWANNWCLAPVIVDPKADEVYFTPMYYALAHFSRFLRPGAKVLSVKCDDKDVMATAVRNPDGTIVVVAINQANTPAQLDLAVNGKQHSLSIAKEAIQTIVIK